MESEERASAGVRSHLSSEAAWSNVVREAATEVGELLKYLDMSRRYGGGQRTLHLFETWPSEEASR